MKDEPISAFAYNVAKEIEGIVDERTNGLQARNYRLEAKVLAWYDGFVSREKKEVYAEFFGIETSKSGIVNK